MSDKNTRKLPKPGDAPYASALNDLFRQEIVNSPESLGSEPSATFRGNSNFQSMLEYLNQIIAQNIQDKGYGSGSMNLSKDTNTLHGKKFLRNYNYADPERDKDNYEGSEYKPKYIYR